MTVSQQPAITAETTIHEVVQRRPAALTVLNRYGMDACCGGELSLAEAARRHGVDLDRLIGELCAP